MTNPYAVCIAVHFHDLLFCHFFDYGFSCSFVTLVLTTELHINCACIESTKGLFFHNWAMRVTTLLFLFVYYLQLNFLLHYMIICQSQQHKNNKNNRIMID